MYTWTTFQHVQHTIPKESTFSNIQTNSPINYMLNVWASFLFSIPSTKTRFRISISERKKTFGFLIRCSGNMHVCVSVDVYERSWMSVISAWNPIFYPIRYKRYIFNGVQSFVHHSSATCYHSHLSSLFSGILCYLPGATGNRANRCLHEFKWKRANKIQATSCTQLRKREIVSLRERWKERKGCVEHTETLKSWTLEFQQKWIVLEFEISEIDML